MSDHLGAGARRVLERSDSERIRYPQVPEMIAYPRASEILSALQELFDYQPMHQMPNLLIYGRTSNGKTMIVHHFSKQYPACDDPDNNNSIVPILTVLAPPTPHEGQFLDEIIHSLYAPGKFSYSLGQKRKQVIDLLAAVKIRMLVIDEIQHVLAGGPVHQRAFVNALKLLGSHLRIPLVAAGTEEALNAFRFDAQMANRFEAFELPRWRMGKDFLRLLASFERQIPLKQPSYLARTGLATKILAMSEGTIGEVSKLLNLAAAVAIRTGQEHIDEHTLDKARYVPPSSRKMG